MLPKGRLMAGHGPIDASTGIDYEESEHSGRVVRIASVAALGGLLFGYDSAVINGAVSAVEDHFQISKFVTGVAVAAALIGAALGAVVAGRLADKIGRLSVMKTTCPRCSLEVPEEAVPTMTVLSPEERRYPWIGTGDRTRSGSGGCSCHELRKHNST